MSLLFAASVQAAVAGSPPQPAAELTSIQWRAAARQDIQAIHDTLRDNAPFMVVQRDSAGMHRWLESGRTEALRAVPKVNDGRSYYFVLARYVGGFRDGHIGLSLTKGAVKGRMPDWPGFAMTYTAGHYQVGWVQPGMGPSTPPIGATLVNCDGQAVEALARSRLDRVLGDLTQEAQRSASAFQLLRDYHFPVRPPRTCVFRTDAGEKSWKLTWSTPTGAEVDTAARAIFAPSAQFGVSRWGDNAWWIGAPTMRGEKDWAALYGAIEENLSVIRAADLVVIDLRGNGGGSSVYGDQLARKLYGDSLVDAHEVSWGDLVFKAGPLSRQWAAEGMAEAKDDPDELASIRPIVEALNAAPVGAPVTIKAPPTAAEVRGSLRSPMKGRVVVLIDHACFSACLDTLDVFTRLPGVKLAGVESGADTIFMDAMTTPLPSGMSSLRFGIKAWVQRQRGSNVPYKPDPALRYEGSLADESGLKAWLARKLGVRASEGTTPKGN